MNAVPFFDSNVLLYSYSNDPRAVVAKRLALEGYTISVQVLNEYASVSRRKLRLDWETVEQRLAAIMELAEHVVPLSTEIHLHGFQIARRYNLQVYDGMILAAALEAGCETLYSEDMHHGLIIEDLLTIRNPFRPKKEQFTQA